MATHSDSKRNKRQQANDQGQPWMAMRTGMVIIGLVSLALGVYVGLQVYAVDGLGPSLVWGFGSAAALWAVFLISLFFNRLVRGR